VRPAARIQAAIEILDAVFEKQVAADRYLNGWARTHRFAGSKDRRAIADMVYDVLRQRGRYMARMGGGAGARTAVLGALAARPLPLDEIEALFDGGPHAPAPLSPEERAVLAAPPPADSRAERVPAWLLPRLEAAFGAGLDAELDALDRRAPLDLRVNTLKGDAEDAMALLQDGFIHTEALPWPANALRVRRGRPKQIETSPAYAQGRVEVQDQGSQLMAALVEARQGALVVDLCAGAGGKTLALASALAGTGRLVACDTAEIRLKRLPPRTARAGITGLDIRLLPEDWQDDVEHPLADLAGRADAVLVDAPCSGSGTWRRNPETRWRLTPETLARLTALQAAILAAAAPLVRPGGRLVYVTCSVLPDENEAIAEAFLQSQPDFALLPAAEAFGRIAPGAAPPPAFGRFARLSPATTGTDGFFAALFSRSGPPGR